MTALRVLHVTPYFAPAYVYGGPPRSIDGLCRGLQAAGVDVEVVTTAANGAGDFPSSPPEGELVGGVAVHRVARRWPRVFFNAPVRPALVAALARADLCHVHGLWNVPEWIATREARARRVPYVLSPRGMLLKSALAHHAWRKRLLFDPVERATIQDAARLHATSPNEADALAAFVDQSRIRVVPNGVDLPPVDVADIDVRAAADIPPGDPIVLFLGRLHPIKRLDLLAEAVAALGGKYPRLRLVVAGRDELGTLAALKPELGRLGRVVRVVGHVEDDEKWAWLREASVLVCCSDSENFGMSVAEAMAARVPVVVTRTCPWPDIEPAGAGFWVEQRVDAIARAIEVLVADPARARGMGERGRLLVETSHSWPAVARLMAQLYDEVVRERATAVA